MRKNLRWILVGLIVIVVLLIAHHHLAHAEIAALPVSQQGAM